jgi:hypothetical protein
MNFIWVQKKAHQKRRAFLKSSKKSCLPTTFVVTTTATAITATTATTTITATTATTTISTVATTTATTTTTTATAGLLWATLFGFVDAEITTHKVGSIHFFDSFPSEVVVGKSDEGESAWAVCFAIKRNEEVFDSSVSGECFFDVVIRSSERQIAEVQFHSL